MILKGQDGFFVLAWFAVVFLLFLSTYLFVSGRDRSRSLDNICAQISLMTDVAAFEVASIGAQDYMAAMSDPEMPARVQEVDQKINRLSGEGDIEAVYLYHLIKNVGKLKEACPR